MAASARERCGSAAQKLRCFRVIEDLISSPSERAPTRAFTKEPEALNGALIGPLTGSLVAVFIEILRGALIRVLIGN